MRTARFLGLVSLAVLAPALASARSWTERALVRNSTAAPSILVSSATVWKDWMAANYPEKPALSEEQKKALALAAGGTDALVAGAIFKDGAPGALAVKYSPSKMTLSALTVLRWTKDGWKPVLRAESSGLFNAKGGAITDAAPVELYRADLQRKPEGLRLILTLGDAGDKLHGDAIGLSWDADAGSYVWPDDSDHD